MTTPLTYWSDKLGKTMPRTLRLEFNITGAAASSLVTSGAPVLTTYGAFASQAVIDNFLGTTNEFLLAAFDATAMGADAFGGIIDMKGQCAKVTSMTAICYSGTGGATKVENCVQAVSPLTASTLATEVAKGANGNIGFRVNFGNTPDFDGLSAGTIVIEICWISK
jgi:hypothetical protein